MNILLYESNSTSKHIKHIIAHKKKSGKVALRKTVYVPTEAEF